MVKQRVKRGVFIGVFLVMWQLLATSGLYSSALLPTVDSVFRVLIQEVMNGELTMAIAYSFWVIFKGLLISLALSIILVGLSRINSWLDEWVSFLITIAHPLPGIAILPLVILWFGIGEKAVLFVVVHSMVWPMTLTINAEVLKLYDKHSRLSKAFNLSKVSSALNIYVMGTLPAVLTGTRIAWSRGWRAFISAEMIFGIVANRSGLGWYLFEQRVYMNAAGLFAGIIAIVICGVLVEEILFKKAEQCLELRWK